MMNRDKQAGFFLWETILLSLFVLTMAAAAGLYVRVAQLQGAAAAEVRADYLARAQISYSQAVLDKDGYLPTQMAYWGDAQDLVQNDTEYMVSGEAAADDKGLWQLLVTVTWEANGRTGRQEYRRCLARHK
ncbi:hypothetical protein [Selenomonas ruminantium]|uniref:hypothetical protein n=1 Tax=Selenomonas ruminantium TaxID=971 RepID=UPI000478BB6A|nr:hypothetical protein [Selenomonas ruminantium]